MIKIKIFGWTSSEKLMNIILKCYDLDKDPNYNYKYCFTCNNDFTHVILFNKAQPKTAFEAKGKSINKKKAIKNIYKVKNIVSFIAYTNDMIYNHNCY